MQLSSLALPNEAVGGNSVAAFHDQALGHPQWPLKQPIAHATDASSVWHWVAENHRNNSCLWDEEDLARRTQVSLGEIAQNKRNIDGFNQARNDATERVDEFLLIALGLVSADSARSLAPVSQVQTGARLNSETAGSIVDRMSIMALKIKAMKWQLTRNDVDTAFLHSTRQKLERLLEQRRDLGSCLDQLLADTGTGKAYFKVYRQFKMYNDAAMNPALLAERKK